MNTPSPDPTPCPVRQREAWLEHVRREVATWPPLSPEQIDVITHNLRPPSS